MQNVFEALNQGLAALNENQSYADFRFQPHTDDHALANQVREKLTKFGYRAGKYNNRPGTLLHMQAGDDQHVYLYKYVAGDNARYTLSVES